MTDALATQAPNLPAFLQDQQGPALGGEKVDSADLRPPRLVICQSMTPQRKRTDPNYIPGLDENQMFNSLSGEIYGEGPLTFTPVKFLGKRAIEFADPEDGGGVVDPAVPLTDPRCQFTVDPANPRKRVPPVATIFHDFLFLLLLPDGRTEPIAVSMKGSQTKVAINFTSMLNLTGRTWFERLYEIRVVSETSNGNTYGNFKITTKRNEDGSLAYVGEATYRRAGRLYDQFSAQKVVLDAEPPPREEEIPY